MAWIPVEESDLLIKISGTELEAFRAAVLASGQADPVEKAIEFNVNLVRGYVAGCQRNTLGLEGTIPDKLLDACVSLIIMDVMSRAGGLIIDPNGERKEAKHEAIKLLELVASCKFGIEVPEDTTDEVIQDFRPSYNDNDRTRSFRSQDGI